MGFYSLVRGLATITAVSMAATVFCVGNNAFAGAAQNESPLRVIDKSDTSQLWLSTDSTGSNLYVVDSVSGESRLISGDFAIGDEADISSDGQFVSYNVTDPETGAKSTFVYETATGEHTVTGAIGSKTAMPVTITVDDSDRGFSASKNWHVVNTPAGNYHYRVTAPVNDPATWSFNVAQAGNYSISVWYPAGSNRSPAAPYILPNGMVVTVNQQTGGGSWRHLATQYLSAGTHNIKLSCWAATGYIVVADKVRLVKL